MSRRAVALFVVLVVAGFAWLVWRADQSDRVIAYSPGVPPQQVVARVLPGHEICQTPLALTAASNAAAFSVGTDRRPAIPLRVYVRDLGGRILAETPSAPGYRDGIEQIVRFRTIPSGARVSFCIRDAGRFPVYPYGTESTYDSGTVMNGHRSTRDLAVNFLRPHPRSLLSLIPAAFRHASVFRFDWVGAWTWWVLLGLLALVAPALCALALRSAVDESDPSAK